MKWIDWCLFAVSQVLGFVLAQSGAPQLLRALAFVLLFPSALVMWFLGEKLAHVVMKDQFHEWAGVICLLLLNALFWLAAIRLARKLRLR